MKLLFDENLSPKMVAALADIFPDSAHVDRIGLGGGSDDEVWRYAKDNGFMIVSKDSDFYEKSILYGHPPKVIWVKRGNSTNRQIQLLLRNKAAVIAEFHQNDEVSVKQRGKMARESGKTASKTVHPDMCHDPVFCRRNLGCCLWILLPKSEGVIL